MRRIATIFALCAVTGASHAEGLAAWLLQMTRQQSALGVTAKQVQSATEARVASRQNTLLSQAQSANERYNIAAVQKTLDDYGPSSQLVDPCYQVGMAGVVSGTSLSTDERAQQAQNRVYTTSTAGMANAGGITGVFGATQKVSGYTYAASVAQRQQRHLNRYCTVAEANAGYCNLLANGMQGGDVDFSVHLAPGTTFGWDQTEAATDFVKTVAPTKPVATNSCKDVTCRSGLAVRRQQEAYMSMARYSMLRFVESRSTQLSGVAKKVVSQ